MTFLHIARCMALVFLQGFTAWGFSPVLPSVRVQKGVRVTKVF